MFVNKTPRFYKVAADYVKKIQENGASLKQLIYSKQHPNIMGLYALVNEVFKHFEQIKFLITHAKLESITSKNPWLIYVLVTELLWGKKHLPDIKSTTFKTILSHKQKLEKLLPLAEKNVPTTEKTVNTPKYVRVNTLKISVSEAIAAFIEEGYNYKEIKNKRDYQNFLTKASSLHEYDFMSDIHFEELLLFHPSCKFFDHKAYQNGLIILQDKASCIPAYFLNPPPDSVVLDACAAPGTKTTLLASLMKNEGTLYAVDRSQSRFQELVSFVEKSGATCVQTVHKDLMNLNESDFPNVQYILVDPSCSGSGMLDRVGETSVDKERLKKLQGIQILLLKHCMRHFHSTKRIVYSTCSIHPEENEEVVKDILSSTYNFKLVSARNLLKGPWVSFGSPKYEDIGKNCLYSRPEKDLTNGFFIAVFEKVIDGEINPYYRKNKQLFSQIKENDTKTVKAQETESNASLVDEPSDRKRDNFHLVLRKKKRRTKKVKREIVTKESTEKQNPHVIFDKNHGNDTENVCNVSEGISEIINNEENSSCSKKNELHLQNSLNTINGKEHLHNTKKKTKRDIDDNREHKEIKKIKKSFKETQSPAEYSDEKEDKGEFISNIDQNNGKLKSKKRKRDIDDDRGHKGAKKIKKSFKETQSPAEYSDEREDKGEFISNIDQNNGKLKSKKIKRDIDDDRDHKGTKKIKKSFKEMQSPAEYSDERKDKSEFISSIDQNNGKLKSKKRKMKLIEADITAVNNNIIKSDMKQEKLVLKHKLPESDIEKRNLIETQKNEQKISADNEWTNGAKPKFINGSIITIDALKVSSEKEKLKNILLKKTFTILNQNDSTGSKKYTNKNNSVLKSNGNELEKKPNESMSDSLEDKQRIKYKNKKNVLHLESTVEKVFEENNQGRKSNSKKNKNTMFPFRGTIENNISLINKAEKSDMNMDYEEISIIKLNVKNKHSDCEKIEKRHVNSYIETGDNKSSTVNISGSNFLINNVKDRKEYDSVIIAKKKSKRKNCNSSI